MTSLAVSNQQTSRYGLVFAANLVSQQSKALSDSAFRLWIILHTYMPKDPSDGWTITAERLSKDAGFSRSTFFRAMAALKDSDLIRVENTPNSGECNRYYLLNARHVRIDFNGETRGVTRDTRSSHHADTGECHPGETHTGAFTGASTSNNPPNPPLMGGRELQGFLGKLLDELYRKLEARSVAEQRGFLLEDLAFHTSEKGFDFKQCFKRMCENTEGLDPICCEIADQILAIAPPESGRQRSAKKRYAFLTECHEAIRKYGRQL